MRNTKSILAVSLVAVAISVAPALAATYNTATDNFTFSMPDTTTWGTPSAVVPSQNKITFNAQAWNVSTNGSDPTMVDSTVPIDIQAINPGTRLGSIDVVAFGSYEVDGQDSQVNWDLTIRFEDQDTTGDVIQGIASSPAFPIIAGQSGVPITDNGSFSAVNSASIANNINFLGEHVVVSLGMMTEAIAGSGTGAGASLNVNVASFAFTFNYVPEPATLSLFFVGGLALVRRRRR